MRDPPIHSLTSSPSTEEESLSLDLLSRHKIRPNMILILQTVQRLVVYSSVCPQRFLAKLGTVINQSNEIIFTSSKWRNVGTILVQECCYPIGIFDQNFRDQLGYYISLWQ